MIINNHKNTISIHDRKHSINRIHNEIECRNQPWNTFPSPSKSDDYTTVNQ